MYLFRRALVGVWLALFALSAHAQPKPLARTLRWATAPQEVLDANQQPRQALWFDGAVGLDAAGLPLFQLFFETAVGGLTLQEVRYEPLIAAERELLGGQLLPTAIVPRFRPATFRKQPATYATFVPLRRHPQTGEPEKLVAFTYRAEADPNPPQARTQGLTNYAANSVLATGTWYKFAVTAPGVYQIDAQGLRDAGIDVSTLDPSRLALYGAGGMLPNALAAPRFDDLRENDVEVVTENGAFQHLRFYSEGPHTWFYNEAENIFQYRRHLYSDTTYYFLTVKEQGLGRRLSSRPSAGGASATFTAYDARDHYEQEQVNLMRSGQLWLGEIFDLTNERTFTFDISGAVPDQPARIAFSAAASASQTTSFDLLAGNSPIGSLSIAANTRFDLGNIVKRVFAVNVLDASGAFRVRYNQAGNSQGYLDYLTLNFKKQLALNGNQTAFRVADSRTLTVAGYAVANLPAGGQVWDVTDPTRPVGQAHNGGSFAAPADGTLREFVAWQGTTLPAPRFVGTVANQNLHGLGDDGVEMLIVTAPEFRSEAERLARFHRNFDALNVAVVTPRPIYNEFSSGAQDVSAIRNYAKLLYDRGDQFRFLLLLGDCSYDFKNRVSPNTNFVPTYQSVRSLNELSSYATEDYYGFLDDNEGDLEERLGSATQDIGVGRLPVKSAAEAAVVVDKIIRYASSTATLGKWRNRIVLVADDNDSNIHQIQADRLPGSARTAVPNLFNFNKVYADAYPQINQPGGELVVEGIRELDGDINEGVLVVNYTGHGNENGWSSEQLLVRDRIGQWDNFNRLAFFVTATCEFGLYDDPQLVSGGELILLSERGAGIGLFTSTRLVFSFQNEAVNKALFRRLFVHQPAGQAPQVPRLGSASMRAKNETYGTASENNLKYSLLADPALRLAVPRQTAVITHINDQPVGTAGADSLRGLQRVRMRGEVRTAGGTRDGNYTGVVEVTVYDKATTFRTFGQALSNENGSFPADYSIRQNIVYAGRAAVSGGAFSFEFVMPKDISPTFGEGKVSLYVRPAEGLQDAGGATFDFALGGIDTTVAADNTPPEIALFMNDETFVFGGTVGPSPLLLARLSDENGINVSTAGIGHSITSALNETAEDIRVLNDQYVADTGSFQSGEVRYDGYRDLAPGRYSLRLKAWDTHNNSAEETIEFVVAEEADLALRNVLNYPNPFTTRTSFHFDHNRAGDQLDVRVEVYTVSGRLIKTLAIPPLMSADTHVGYEGSGSEIIWDGRDDFGDRIGRGVYIYRVKVRASDGTEAQEYQKLVILN